MENNFKCKKCGKEFHIVSYRVVVRYEITQYLDKSMRNLSCPFCKNIDLEFLQGETNFKSIQIGKFSNLSNREKQNLLRKRAHEHHQKHDLDLVKFKNEQMEGKLISNALNHGKNKS